MELGEGVDIDSGNVTIFGSFGELLATAGVRSKLRVFAHEVSETLIDEGLVGIGNHIGFESGDLHHRGVGVDLVVFLLGFLNLSRFGNSLVLFNPLVNEVIEDLHIVVDIGHIVSGGLFSQAVLAVFGFGLLSLEFVEDALPFVQVRDVRIRNIFKSGFVFGDSLFGLLDLLLPEVNLVGIFEAFAVPNEVGFGEFSLSVGKSLLGSQHDDGLVDIGIVSGLILFDGSGDSGFLVGRQILGSEGDVAESVTQRLLSQCEFLFQSNHVDFVSLADLFHHKFDAFDFSSDLGFTSFEFSGGTFDFQFFELTLKGLHLRIGIGLSLDRVGLGLTKSGFSSLDLGAGTLEFSVSGTQVFQRADVFSFGVAEVLDALRLDLLNTGSEKTAGSNHDHQ